MQDLPEETKVTGMKMNAEIVFFYLYDAGRSIDLKKVAKIIPANPDIGVIKKKRDTPESLTFPVPLVVQLAKISSQENMPFDSLSMNARIYEEGVITMRVRVTGNFAVQDLHKIRTTPFLFDGEQAFIDTWVESDLKRLFETIKEAITFEQYISTHFVRETYTAFCITSPLKNPKEFVQTHRRTLACLLNGESPDTDLHESQIAATLKDAFCYTEHDCAVFDLDRALIIDPDGDYEDILLVIEQANYQLLELRSLDALLDRWLDKAEDDITVIYKKKSARLKLLKVKLASIHALSFDALFILENLENSSKIIGDFFLGQIFDTLCVQFNTEGWKRSIERRLSTLGSIYERVNADASERRMVFLEVMFIVVCVIFPVLQIFQAFMLSN